ncbi:hypothetical protein CEE44_05035 [Candidatus Woesearchaeota archaeon B3_Woes]|nr:MAG: hypothetical protein CEE44_05035 [Candidatus Woesearchaeota archaeon B3_Woes]
MGKIILIVIIFLVIGGYLIKTNLNADFDESGDRVNFIKEFARWVFQLGKSTKNTVGYAVSQEWLPETNKTNITEN